MGRAFKWVEDVDEVGVGRDLSIDGGTLLDGLECGAFETFDLD